MAKTNPARGMRDFLPVDVRKREYVIGIIKQVYESYGYEPLETPAVENIETLMGKYGEEGNQLVFKILKRGEKLKDELAEFGELTESRNSPNSANSGNSLTDLALRYDLTVPLARVVANRRNELPKFFKRYQIQPVWRADRPARGRFREFYQCDVDAIGSESLLIEADLIGAVGKILTKLGFEDFVVRVNNRKILTAILNYLAIQPEIQPSVLIAVDKLDKVGIAGVIKELNGIGIGSEASDAIAKLFAMAASVELIVSDSQTLNNIAIDTLRSTIAASEEGSIAIREIETLLGLCNETDSEKLRFDFSLARGLSYYTGTIMEINVPDLAGSLGGGGRYDGLIGMFGKEQIPACGFSLGLERILVVMDERGMFPPEIADSRAADVMVTIWNEETISESLKLADELRAQGLRVLVYPEADKLGKQIKYADSIGIPFVCVMGESELAEGKFTVKNMKTGEQETVERDTLLDLKKRISSS